MSFSTDASPKITIDRDMNLGLLSEIIYTNQKLVSYTSLYKFPRTYNIFWIRNNIRIEDDRRIRHPRKRTKKDIVKNYDIVSCNKACQIIAYPSPIKKPQRDHEHYTRRKPKKNPILNEIYSRKISLENSTVPFQS